VVHSSIEDRGAEEETNLITCTNPLKRHYASQLGKRCRKAGLLVSAEEENLLTMFPALTIERESVRDGLDILEECL
jgi:4-aminobutyrate aminotransferase-like enzyme